MYNYTDQIRSDAGNFEYPWMYGSLGIEGKGWMYQGRMDIKNLLVCPECAHINYGHMDCGDAIFCNQCGLCMLEEGMYLTGNTDYDTITFRTDFLYAEDASSLDQWQLENPLGAHEFASDMEWPLKC